MWCRLGIRILVSAMLAASVLVGVPADASGADPEPTISEVLADNDTGRTDADGDRPDWIEIHNPGPTAVDLAGWALSDDPADESMWVFPTIEVPAGGYLVVFASGKYRLDPAELHTNFKLSKDGDQVHLFRPNATLAASIRFDRQTADVSIGPGPNGSTIRFAIPTPGAANAAGAIAPPAKPILSRDRGVYTGGLAVAISSTEVGAVVRYTTNGSVPTAASPVAPAVLNIGSTTMLRARAFNAAGASATTTATYVITGDIINASYMNRSIATGGQYGHRMQESLLSIPSVSLVGPNSIVESEYRQISMEWLDPTGGDTFQIDAGIKLYGHTSLNDPKKNMRLKFSSEFGPTKLEFPLYEGFETGAAHGIVPATSFDQLQLRQGSGDSQLRDRINGTHLRNTLADDTMLEMGIPNPHNRFVHVYINGAYRGVYQLRERFDADFMASYYGGDDSEYAAVNRAEVFDGPANAWTSISSNRTYNALSYKLNIDAFADLAVFQWWNGTTDWHPEWNWQAAGPINHANPIGWIFHNNDHDWGLGRAGGINQNSLGLEGPSSILKALNAEKHPDWIDAVSRSITRNLYGNGPLTPTTGRARLDRRVAQIQKALVAETARWPTNGWDVDGEWTAAINWLRSTWFPQRTSVVLGQLGTTFRKLAEPSISPCCHIAAGTNVTISTAGGAADIVYTTDDTDPRSAGGGAAPGATWIANTYSTTLRLDRSTVITARVYKNGNWSSPMRWDMRVNGQVVDVVLNEWNAVSGSSLIEEQDATLGRVGGNGGDWFELVVVSDHADLRGYRFDTAEGAVPRSTVTLSNHALWSDLRAGTIITIAEDLATDVGYDPTRGDWHINVQANSGGNGLYVSADNFVVSADDWRLTIRNADGGIVFGPAGEGIGGLSGVTDTEVGELEATPSGSVSVNFYGDSNGSTFGLPNVYEGTTQDLATLRSVVPRLADTDGSGTVDLDDPAAILADLVGDPVADYHPEAGNLDGDQDTDLVDAMRLAQCVVDSTHAHCAALDLG